MKIDYKIEIEKRLATLEQKVSELISNHIPHLEDKMDKLIWLVLGTLLTAFVSLVVRLIK